MHRLNPVNPYRVWWVEASLFVFAVTLTAAAFPDVAVTLVGWLLRGVLFLWLVVLPLVMVAWIVAVEVGHRRRDRFDAHVEQALGLARDRHPSGRGQW